MRSIIFRVKAIRSNFRNEKVAFCKQSIACFVQLERKTWSTLKAGVDQMMSSLMGSWVAKKVPQQNTKYWLNSSQYALAGSSPLIFKGRPLLIKRKSAIVFKFGLVPDELFVSGVQPCKTLNQKLFKKHRK